MKILAQLPDVEDAVVNYLTTALASRGETVTVGNFLPSKWVPGSTRHVLVSLDGTLNVDYPIKADASIRITTWADTTQKAKALVNLCEGLMLSYMGDRVIAQVRSLAGAITTKDINTKGQLAFIVVRVTARYVAL